jgi:hypothetical protein
MLLAHFGTVGIFEPLLPSKSPIGEAMKEERRRRGDVGLDGSVGGTIDIDGLTVDLTHLHNTHSFVELAS